jgi:hypothetical protein
MNARVGVQPATVVDSSKPQAKDLIDGSAIHASHQQLLLSFVLLTAIGASLVAVSGSEGLCGGFLASLMTAIAIVDSRRFIIPNGLTAAPWHWRCCAPERSRRMSIRTP